MHIIQYHVYIYPLCLFVLNLDCEHCVRPRRPVYPRVRTPVHQPQTEILLVENALDETAVVFEVCPVPEAEEVAERVEDEAVQPPGGVTLSQGS